MLNTAEFPQQVGPYRIDAEIGQGYGATVYRAFDTLYDRVVALKILPEHLTQDTTYVRRFISAGREAARLRHPHIVQVFDAGQAGGLNYIAQEYVEGGTLAARLQARSQPFTLYETEQVVTQLALALDYAHQQGEVHGNLNPNNILFVSDHQVKIADFGLAQLLPAADPFYYPARVSTFMSPEQARGELRIDQRADIYSLGILTYLMLTGRPPFQAENPLALVRKIIDDEAPIATTAPGRLVPRIAHALQRVLAKQPTVRYTAAGEFAQAFLHGEPIAPPAPAEAMAESAQPMAEDATATTTAQEFVNAAAVPLVLPLPEYTYTHARRPVRPTHSRSLFSFPFLAMATFVLALITLLRITWTTWGEPVLGNVGSPMAGVPLQIAGMQLTPPFPPTLLPVGTGQRLTAMAMSLTPNAVMVAMSSAEQAGAAVDSANTPAAPPTLRVLPTLTATDTSNPPTATVAATATTLPTASDTPTTLPSPTLSPTASPTASPTSTPSETATAEPTLPPTPSPAVAPGGRIAYTRWDHNRDRYDLVFYTVASGENWPIVRDRRQPDFSPQNNLASNGDGGFIDNLILMGPNGENPVPVSAFAEDAHPHWAPTGKLLAFDSTRVGDGRRRIYVHRDTDYGQPVSPLMFEAWEIFGSYPVFLADSRIAYNGCDVWENASKCGVFVVDTNGGKPTGVTNWPGDLPTDNLGREVLTMSNRSGNWDIYRVDPASGAVIQLTNDAAQDGLATASPDGDYIAFVTNREGPWSVYTMRTDGSDTHKLFDLDVSYGSGDRGWLEERITWGR